jgi:hypothetical protein
MRATFWTDMMVDFQRVMKRKKGIRFKCKYLYSAFVVHLVLV